MKGLYRWDMDAFRAVNVGWHSDALTPLFWALSYSGLGWVQVLLTLALLRFPAARRFVAPLLATVAFTGLALAQGLKHGTVNRDRPSFLGFAFAQEGFKHTSFPSGHTTTAFAMAAMFALVARGRRQTRWIPLVFLWAVGVGVSRVYRGVHWPTDVLAGACAGVLGSALLYLLFERRGWLDLTLRHGAGLRARRSATPTSD